MKRIVFGIMLAMIVLSLAGCAGIIRRIDARVYHMDGKLGAERRLKEALFIANACKDGRKQYVVKMKTKMVQGHPESYPILKDCPPNGGQYGVKSAKKDLAKYSIWNFPNWKDPGDPNKHRMVKQLKYHEDGTSEWIWIKQSSPAEISKSLGDSGVIHTATPCELYGECK